MNADDYVGTYFPDDKHPLVPHPDKSTLNKAKRLFPKLWILLDKYDAVIEGDTEQEVSSIIIDGVNFNWLDDRDAIKVVVRNYLKGRLEWK